MMKLLTEDDFKRAAQRLGCGVAEIKAVAEVESRGAGFLSDGRPKILFERHIFRRELVSAGIDVRPYERQHSELVNRKPGGYIGGSYEWNRFDEAVTIHRDAAIKSCSWGRFQIMGFNWRAAGARSVQDFVNRMYRSEGAQLDAFVSFVINEGMADELRSRNWAEFARRYNGPDYQKNKYDTKLAAAFAKFSKAKGGEP